MEFEIELIDTGYYEDNFGTILLVFFVAINLTFSVFYLQSYFRVLEPIFIISYIILCTSNLIVGILYQIGAPHRNLTYYKTGSLYGLISNIFLILVSIYEISFFQHKINEIYMQFFLGYYGILDLSAIWNSFIFFGIPHLNIKLFQDAINGILFNYILIIISFCIILWGYNFMRKHGRNYGFKYSIYGHDENFGDLYIITKKELSKSALLQDKEKTKLCKKCLKPVPIDAKFCIHCGVPM